MNRIMSLLCTTAIGATMLSGCIVTVDFTPFGSDFAVAANWTVNGKQADAVSCSEAGIDRVRVIFWDGGTFYDYADLTAPCSAGSFQTDKDFRWGDYQTQWQALDADGNVLGIMTERFDLIVLSPITMATLAPIDFISTGVPATTLGITLGFATPDGTVANANCDTAGVATMDYVLNVNGVDIDSMNGIACSDLTVPEPALGPYALTVTGYDGAGAKNWEGTCSFDVVAGGNVVTCDFPYTGVPPTPSIAVNFTFDGMDCATAGVTLLSYQVNDTGGAMVAGTQSQTAGTCMDAVLFDMGLVDAMSYTIFVDAEGTGGVKFGANCAVTASVGGPAIACNAAMM